MFDVEICEERQVVLVRFGKSLTEEDFGQLDELGAQAKGDGKELDCIFDLTTVDQVDLATEFVAKRGDLPQAYSGRQRIYVVPQDDLKLLVRLYASYQESRGWRPPSIVATLDEAFARLGVVAGDFRPFAGKP